MVLVSDVYSFINEIAPFDSAMDFDNVGVLVGDKNQEVKKVLIALDITNEVINEAKAEGVQLIISHHPVIFDGLKKVSAGDVAFNLIQSGITAICAHTNLDIAENGVNKCLANALGLTDLELLSHYKAGDWQYGLGLVGRLNGSIDPDKFAQVVKSALGCLGLRYTNVKRSIKRVAICSGSGGNLINHVVAAHADAYVTGEIKHHEILIANENNICVVDAGHFKTEDVVVQPLISLLASKFTCLEFIKSARCTDHIKYV